MNSSITSVLCKWNYVCHALQGSQYKCVAEQVHNIFEC